MTRAVSAGSSPTSAPGGIETRTSGRVRRLRSAERLARDTCAMLVWSTARWSSDAAHPARSGNWGKRDKGKPETREAGD